MPNGPPVAPTSAVVRMDRGFDLSSHPMARVVVVRPIDDLADVLALMHAGVSSSDHLFKSYPQEWVEKRDFAALTDWLGITTSSSARDASGGGGHHGSRGAAPAAWPRPSGGSPPARVRNRESTRARLCLHVCMHMCSHRRFAVAAQTHTRKKKNTSQKKTGAGRAAAPALQRAARRAARLQNERAAAAAAGRRRVVKRGLAGRRHLRAEHAAALLARRGEE